MAHVDPKEAFGHLEERVLAGITAHFPIEGRLQSLHLEALGTKDNLRHDDLQSQHQAKVEGRTWAVPVYADLCLRDNASGKVVDRRRMKIAEIPKTTARQSYLVDGQEYQVDSQWQLKPGVYTRRRDNGELETRFNVTGKRSFDVTLDPASNVFHLEYAQSHVPIYPVLKALGVDDDTLERSWGKEILHANKNARLAGTALERLYKADRRAAPPSPEAAREHVFRTMAASRLRPDATELTLGRPFTEVTGDALRLATQKMLHVQGGAPEDDRDSLLFKDLRSVGDFAFDRLTAPEQRRALQWKALRKLNAATHVGDVWKTDFLARPVKEVFTKNSAARTASQINPLEMLSSALQTTLLGPGGIQSERSITDEAKFVNPSHLGFLDPIHTPEGQKTGVTLRLPLGIRKIGSEAKIPVYDRKTDQVELISPREFLRSSVVLPDQVRWEDGKPAPLTPEVKYAGDGNAIRKGPFSDARYVMRHSSQMFNMTSNLIPFLGSTSGNRASMASRQMEQAISLVNREAPLVQVATGTDNAGTRTFEEVVGRQASHVAPATGTVEKIADHAIHIRDQHGALHEVATYHHYPLNDAKSVMHSEPLVKVGDRVTEGDVVADTNFTKKGALALGTNLRVAYLPFRGYNFEDGIVISETAARKLSSEHLHKPQLAIDPEVAVSRRTFELEHPSLFSKVQLSKVSADGVVAVGTKVEPGDPLILATKPFAIKDRTGLSAIRRSMSGSHTDKSLRWDSDTAGEVVAVHRGKDRITVHVRTREAMDVGDKMAGRHGNKGVVAAVLPDHEMPHTQDGRPIEVALNPSGVPGRMNIGQVLETASAKIAEKTGKPYFVRNFEPNTDFLEKVQRDVKAHGLSDQEELFDPVTKQPLGRVLVGPQYVVKLVHQVDKKLSVRSGMSLPGQSPERYDLNLQPSAGGHAGGQSMGTLGMYALLAHGATANLREMQTWKSEGPDAQTDPNKKWPSVHNAVWAAIQTGAPLPPPKPTFAWRKFTDQLTAAGINLEKHGHQLVLSPLTDRHILDLAPHELPKPAELLQINRKGEPEPRPGGLFDERRTGGHGGRKWSRIGLAEPLPNPIFEHPICHLTGLRKADYDAIVRGEKSISPAGKIGPVGEGLTGGRAIEALLQKIDVPRALAEAKRELGSAKGAAMDKALKRTKYLGALEQLGLTPQEAYVLHHLPVLPPVMRPVSVMADGNLKYSDINGLYSEFGQLNDQLRDPTLQRHLTDGAKSALRADYYDGVRALMGVGVPYADAKHKGILHSIGGSQPKNGFFQNTLMNRRQDLTLRSTIVPEPALGLDEVGIPRHAALDLFRPFLVKKLVDLGAARTALDAPKLLESKPPIVWKALEKVMDERPILLKRDPALHKYSVQAFKARPVHGNAIKIHPLVTSGFNADFDGDTMSAYVPIHDDAVREAHKMLPSRNLFSEATGRLVYQPTLESALGLYKLSLVGRDTKMSLAHEGHVLDEVRKGTLSHDDVVTVNGRKTTAGRILLAAALPASMQHEMLSDLERRLNRKGLDRLLTQIAKSADVDYGAAVNQLKDLGNGATFGSVAIPRPSSSGHALSFSGEGAKVDPKANVFLPVRAHSLGLADFATDKATREPILADASKEVAAIEKDSKLGRAEKDRRAIQVWQDATAKMKAAHEKKLEARPTNLFQMYQAGVKPGWDQYQQMVIAPMLFRDSANRTLPMPVTKSYAEGLDVGGYWAQMPGARRGSVMKTQEVQEPGYMSKLLMNSMMDLVVAKNDCGAEKGALLPIRERDVHDRYLAADVHEGDLHVPRGTLLSPDVVAAIRSKNAGAHVHVRSPLTCEEPHGLCQRCVGLSVAGQDHPVGTNIGVLSAHAVGERAIQLSLKSFHTGGVAEVGGGSKLLNQFSRFQQLMHLPEKIPDAASLSMKTGTIERIDTNPTGVTVTIDGRAHHVGKDSMGQPLHTMLPSAGPTYRPWRAPKVGMHVEAGDHLSDPNRTVMNPRDLFRATRSIEKVQEHLTDEVYGLYKDEGIRRRAIEVVVKAMSNLTRIDDPGGDPHALRGEFQALSVVKAKNRQLAKDGKPQIEHTPAMKGIEVMPLAVQEDWAAKLQHRNLRDTLMEAAATRGISNLHGTHPVPGLAYGAEFGLNRRHSSQAGRTALETVPEHHY